MNLVLPYLPSIFVIAAGVLALLKFRGSDNRYLPFFIFMWAASLTETLAAAAGFLFRNNLPVYNLYVLAEGCLLLWLFFNLNVFSKRKIVFVPALVLLTAAWVAEWIHAGSLVVLFTLYRILLSVIMVIMAVQLLTVKADFLQAPAEPIPRRLIAAGIILYFSYKILVECIFYYGLTKSFSFQIKLLQLLQVVDVVSTFIYLLALYRIPRHQTVEKKRPAANSRLKSA